MKRAFLILAGLLVLLTLSGCAGVTIDELYSLPQPQEEFLQLQALIDAEIAAGSEYSAPTAGSQRQSVQQADLDGDGIDEIMAFLKNSSTIPVIHVYRMEEGQYVPACTITGEGSDIGRVEYSDLDGDGFWEIVVSWKTGADIATVSAYSIKDWDPALIKSANCRDFLVGNMAGDANPEVVVLNFGDDGGVVSMHSLGPDGEIVTASAGMSASLTSADRFRLSSISGGVPAVFVEGHFQEDDKTWYLTDIFTASRGGLKNISLDEESGNSGAVRASAVYSQDINSDGIMEVPMSQAVFRQPRSSEYYIFDWFSYDIHGERELCASTYHCYSDGWFYVLPQEWRDSFTVRRETGGAGERTVVLSTADRGGRVTDRLVIYTLTGENRLYRSKLPGRFILVSGETSIFAAESRLPAGQELSEEEKNDIIGRFNLIYSEWIQGAV